MTKKHAILPTRQRVNTIVLYVLMCVCVNVYAKLGYVARAMGCPPVRGDNPRGLASGLSYVQVDKHGITILYHLHQCRPCTSSDISC